MARTMNVDPVQLRRGIGYVIQQVGLFPHQTVRRNVGTVCRLLGWDSEKTDGRADEMLDLVGLDPPRSATGIPPVVRRAAATGGWRGRWPPIRRSC